MPYTQEQIEEAKKWLTKNDRGDPNTFCAGIRLDYERMILATLEAAQKERERAFGKLSFYGVPRERAHTVSNGIDVLVTRMQKEAQSLTHRAAHAEAYTAKLEKAGDGMRLRLAFNYKPCVTWDAARKEKP